MASKIKKDDTVLVIAGKDKGKAGKVLRMADDGNRVVVDKVNLIKRHLRPSQKYPQGGIVEREAPLHISNVMLVSTSTGQPFRPKFQHSDATGQKVRVNPKTGETLD